MGRSQAIARYKGLIQNKPVIIGPKRDPAGRGLIQESRKFYCGCALGLEMMHQVVTCNTALHQSFHQQHMLSFDLYGRAVVDLFTGSAPGRKFMHMGFDELADHRYLQISHQVGHEHKAIFQHSDHAAGPAPVVFRDLPGQFPYAFLDLLWIQQNTLFSGSGGAQVNSLVISKGSLKFTDLQSPTLRSTDRWRRQARRRADWRGRKEGIPSSRQSRRRW